MEPTANQKYRSPNFVCESGNLKNYCKQVDDFHAQEGDLT